MAYFGRAGSILLSNDLLHSPCGLLRQGWVNYLNNKYIYPIAHVAYFGRAGSFLLLNDLLHSPCGLLWQGWLICFINKVIYFVAHVAYFVRAWFWMSDRGLMGPLAAMMKSF